MSLGDPATPGAYGSIILGVENGTPLIRSYNPITTIPFVGHPSGRPQSFAAEGGAPEPGLSVSHMNQLLAQQELLRQIASAVGAKNLGGDVNNEVRPYNGRPNNSPQRDNLGNRRCSACTLHKFANGIPMAVGQNLFFKTFTFSVRLE